MNIKQNPFSLFDALGYFTPGAIFLYGVLLFLGHVDSNSNPLEYVNSVLGFQKAGIYIPFVLLSYIIGHFLSFISSITIEKYSIWAHGYPSKYLLGISNKGYFHSIEKHSDKSILKILRIVLRTVILFALLPISLFDYFLNKIIPIRDIYCKPLDPLLCNVLRKRIEVLIDDHADVENREEHGDADVVDFFLYVYHYAVEHASTHFPKMQNYVALYGFLRTLTLISVLLFWSILWHFNVAEVASSSIIMWLILSMVISFVFFMSFVKFYRRFSLEALMAMAVTFRSPNKSEMSTPKSGEN